MKRTLLSLIGFVASVSLVTAAAPPCVPGTLATYIALGSEGCSIGPVTVGDFAYSAKASGGAQQIPPDHVQVSPSIAIPAAASLSFSANWQVTSGQTQDSFIKYTVVGAATASGELTLQLGTYQVGFGTAVVRENTDVGNLRVFATCGEVACNSKRTDTLQFSPAAVGLQVVDHVKLSAILGPTSLSGFSAKFDFCPACV